MWKICKLVFVLFHGQFKTKRGFNVNKNRLVENFKETSLTGQRVVFNYVSCTGIEIQDFTVINDLALRCEGAHAKYVAALE